MNSADIDQIIKTFKDVPTRDNYFTVKQWYQQQNSDDEYLICVYLFLQGANIKNNFEPLTKEEHRTLIVQLRDFIETAEPLYKARRKAYLDYGSKSGYYK